MKIKGYFPGAIGKITALHAVYYHENWGFDVSFEIQVGSELSDFMSQFDKDRDGLWTCNLHDDFSGSVAIDGRQTETQGARLRWFIVFPPHQGQGIGSCLLQQAVDFCKDAGHKKIFLWTFQGLEAARTLYERKGFELCQEHRVQQWGRTINEQMFQLIL